MSGPTTVILDNTESGDLVVAGTGDLGTAATLTSPRCSVNLGASSLSGNLYSLRISSTAPNGTSLPVFAQYIAGYCQENCETFATLGSWTVQAGSAAGTTGRPDEPHAQFHPAGRWRNLRLDRGLRRE